MGNSSKDKRDIFYRLAKELGYRARSAFKLCHIDQEIGLFEGVERVVDLCAAPGSWSQVLVEKLKPFENSSVKIVSVDLQEIAPLAGVELIQGDITKLETANEIINCFKGGKAQLVVCDGAPDVTGLHDMDEYIQAQLLLAAFNITSHVLETGGTFVAKIFRGKDMSLLVAQMNLFFKNVFICKPRSSRDSSIESFIVCRGFSLPDGYQPTMEFEPNQAVKGVLEDKVHPERRRCIAQFLACGDLEFDSDAVYSVPDDHVVLEVLQKPINPPYQHDVK